MLTKSQPPLGSGPAAAGQPVAAIPIQECSGDVALLFTAIYHQLISKNEQLILLNIKRLTALAAKY